MLSYDDPAEFLFALVITYIVLGQSLTTGRCVTGTVFGSRHLPKRITSTWITIVYFMAESDNPFAVHIPVVMVCFPV